ncbi:ATP-binding sensor histidine kinase [Janthinobacterium sp. PC23-8]|uniref:ATP-binding sensor histidine kinase n=1 Tax=Janthinobacterium sp. PC23-8 TaxID=2012679 RepID=UPI000B969E8B|nr:ATP-binding sensor histidine kinase [Janthinobacterium sp. PC23-8]OYO30931.1 hypothetical protein CD932_07180 [Janthinobacterium sp. PC23-8]
MNPAMPNRDEMVLADGGLAAYACEQLSQDGVLATMRARHCATGHAILITTAASQPQAADAVHYLNNEYALRAQLDVAWARRPHGIAWHNGAMALLYPDLGDTPLSNCIPAVGHIEAFLAVALSLCAAVRAMHGAGILHQNIKPANVLVDDAGHCRLRGFGIASVLSSGVRSGVRTTAAGAAGTVHGTPAYMSPEQTGRSPWPSDRRSDLYSLGVTLYELLAGQLPFAAAHRANSGEWIHAHLASEPLPPHRHSPTVPPMLSALVLKLLAKDPGQRYQSAAALEADLEHCLQAWRRYGRIDEFAPGLEDAPALRFSSKLFGRDDAMEALLGAYRTVAGDGKSAMLLVHGPSGVGKTALVAQFLRHPAVCAASVASAKVDQFGGAAPYVALSEALRGLVMCILGQSASEVEFWRARVRHAFDGDAAMLRDLALGLMPELALLAGEPAPRELPDISGPESANRQMMTVLRLLQIFAVRERPLLLVIDDVQWLDAATAALLAELVSQLDALPIMLLVTSRSGQDGAALPAAAGPLRLHPRAGEIVLSALAPAALEAMLAETLSTVPAHVAELAQLVYRKTAGNPYFVQQFLQTVVDERLVLRAAASGTWYFQLEKIAALHFTDNVAELTLTRLARLPESTRRVLQGLACLGRLGSAGLLQALHEVDEADMQRHLAVATTAGVLIESPGGPVFSHDRLQEAAYAELDSATRDALHVRLGLLMVANGLAGERDDLLFSAMEHLQKAPQLLPAAQQQRIAEAALLAGRRARRACAYDSALSYLDFAHGLACAAEAPWAACLRFEAQLERAHCHCLGGNLDTAQAMLPALRRGPQERRIQGEVLRLASEVALRRGDYAQALQHTLEGLRAFGIDMPEHPDDAECERAYAALRVRLQGDWRTTLHALPPLDDPDMTVAMSLLSGMLLPASFSSPSLLFLHLCHTLQVSLDYGICGATTTALAWFGVMSGERHGAYAEGFEYADTARSLVERHGLRACAAPVLLALDQISVWTQPLSSALQYARAGYDAALVVGDLPMASLEQCHRICMLITRGDALEAVAAEIASARAFVATIEFRDMDKILQVQQWYVNHLRGLDDEPLVQGIVANSMAPLRFWHLVYQAGPAFLDGDLVLARACLQQAAALAWSAPAHVHQMEFHLFSVLALCAAPAPDADPAACTEQLQGHVALLAKWAQANPATFADKHALAMAAMRERAGDAFGALALYEQAALHAQAQGFHHYTAFAHELAARLCRRGALATAEQAHLRGAIDAYRRWGALRRVRQLEVRYSQAMPGAAMGGGDQQTVSLIESAELRDVDSIVRASIALSQEIETDALARSLMGIALEHASAQRGLLIRMQGETPLIEAHALLTGRGVDVTLAQSAPHAQDLPLTMLHTAMRTLKPVSVGAEPRPAPFRGDAYLQHYSQCSAICIPMLKQARLVGMLYLENRSASAAFTGEQARVLLLLAAQAAVSLETAALYAELLQENQHRREVEKTLRERRAMMLQGERINRSGSWTWDLSEATINGTPELCRIFGLSDPQPTMPLSIFVEALHPDDQPRVTHVLEHAIAQRKAYTMDYRIIDPDGKIRHLSCVGEPMAGTGGSVFVGTTVDITARRVSEDSLRQAQVELARVSRLTTVGQLTSSIAHEINQPLMSIASNAGASLRWLDRDPPHLDRVRSGLQEIAEQSQRAGQIIRGLRALTRKGIQESAPVDLHATIRHIVLISRAELERNEVKLELALNARCGWVEGDAVQLQQVLLNLVVNALDAMAGVAGRSRVLAIATCSQERQMLVHIDDTGVGLEPASAARMFDPYYTTKHEGMGMGLAICRSIIEAHAGSITAEVRHPHGCSVVFRLAEKD